MYDNPPIALAMSEGRQIQHEQAQEAIRHFEDFYEEIFTEISNFGEIDELLVCDNIGDHLVGNVYVKFVFEEEAEKCLQGLKGRYYSGKIINPEFSPVTDFRESRCRQYDEGNCTRGGYCNFMHLKHVGRSFKKTLYKQMYEEHEEYQNKDRYKKRSSRDDRHRRDDHKSSRRRSDRDRSNSRDKKRSNRRDTKKRSRSRDRSRDKKRSNRRDSRSRSRSRSSKGGDKSSEERRKMIAQWNDEDEKSKNPETTEQPTEQQQQPEI